MNTSLKSIFIVLFTFIWNLSFADTNKAQPYSVATLQGIIYIDAALQQKMNIEWKIPATQWVGNKMDIQVWTVSYKNEIKNPSITDVILQQQLNTPITTEVTNAGIKYTLGNVSGSNIAVIVFCSKLNAEPNLRMVGNPNNGTGNGVTHGYLTDAKKRFTNNKVSNGNNSNIMCALYSIVPNQTDNSQVNFKINILGAPNCKTCFDLGDVGKGIGDLVDDAVKAASKVIGGITYVFDQTIKGVGGLAKVVFNGAGDVAGYFINESDQVFFETANGLINLVFYGNLPQVRDLHQDEYDWANAKIFNKTLPDRGRIKVFNFMSPIDQKGGFTAHRYNTLPSSPLSDCRIYMNLGDAFDNPIAHTSSNYPNQGQVFIHEMTHAWQIGNEGCDGMIKRYFGAGGNGQSYDLGDCSKGLNGSYNIEQEAHLSDATYATIYFNAAKICPFQQQWVENHIRRGVKFDVAQMNATAAMRQHALAFTQYLGDCRNAQAFHSNGNPTDGDGYFTVGSVPNSFLYYRSRDKKVFANWGNIRNKYAADRMEFGNLGWPDNDLVWGLRNNGSYQRFEHGYIYSSPLGTFAVQGKIFDTWAGQKWETGPLGYPTSDFISTSRSTGVSSGVKGVVGAGYQKFEHGEIRIAGFNAQPEIVSNLVKSAPSSSAVIKESNMGSKIIKH